MSRSSEITFKTVNNRLDPALVKADEMVVAENIEILDDNSIRRRKGRSLFLSASSPHSLWSTDDEEFTYFVEAGVLKRITVEGVVSLGLLATDDYLDYQKINNIVVFSSEKQIGYIGANQSIYSFVVDGQNHKINIVPGKFIAFYRGRLYVLNDAGIYYSDPYAIQQMDERSCLIPLLGEPRMLIALDDCLWVGKGDKVIRITGLSPDEFSYKEFSSKVVPYSAKTMNRMPRMKQEEKGRFCLWVSDDGICKGTNSGEYSLVTEDFLVVKQADLASAFIREESGMAHYIVSLKGAGSTRNQFDPLSISVDSENIT